MFHFSSGRRMPGLSPGRFTPVVLPNPNRFAAAQRRLLPITPPTFAMPMLLEYTTTSVRVRFW